MATLDILVKESGFEWLEALSSHFEKALRSRLGEARATIVRQGSIVWLVFQEEAPRRAEDVQSEAVAVYNRAYQAILDRGVYLPPSGYEVMFVSLAHTAKILDKAASTIAASIG